MGKKTIFDMAKNAPKKKDVWDLPPLPAGDKHAPFDYSEAEKRIIGASHVPQITKGVYNVGGTVTGRMSYNQGPTTWLNATAMVRRNGKSTLQAVVAEEMMRQMGEELEAMCGDCIGTKVTGGFDARNDYTRTCKMCGTIWKGLEMTDRRGAIRDQKARKTEESFHCSSCGDVGCSLCL